VRQLVYLILSTPSIHQARCVTTIFPVTSRFQKDISSSVQPLRVMQKVFAEVVFVNYSTRLMSTSPFSAVFFNRGFASVAARVSSETEIKHRCDISIHLLYYKK